MNSCDPHNDEFGIYSLLTNAFLAYFDAARPRTGTEGAENTGIWRWPIHKLRFRSGAAAVTIDGCADGNPVPVIRERPTMQGFLIAVECHTVNKASMR